MRTIKYAVMVPVEGLSCPWCLCMCYTTESACEVVRALHRAWGHDPKEIVIRPVFGEELEHSQYSGVP